MLPTRPSDPLPDRSLDHYARLVRRLLRAPVALVTMIQEHDQVFLGADGLDGRWDRTRRAPLGHSPCQYVVSSGHPVVVNDVRRDLRFAEHPGLTEMGIVAYAGWPLREDSGAVVGSICAIGHAAREWTTDDVDVLRDLATGCSAGLRPRSSLAAVLHQLAQLEHELASAQPAVADRVAAIRRAVDGTDPGHLRLVADAHTS